MTLPVTEPGTQPDEPSAPADPPIEGPAGEPDVRVVGSPAPGRGRRLSPQTFGGVVYLAVVTVTVAGLLVVAFGPWRRGVALIGMALLVAAALRLLLREGNAGMLRVRGRIFDVVALAGVGTALIVLAANIPNQPGL